jgi:protein-tyrosine phosphatase
MAEAFLRRKLAVAGQTAVRVHSAGLMSSGRSMPDEGISVMVDWGIDLVDHRSTQMTDDMLDAADLIVAMAREHVREVVVNVPQAWPRTFTLREIVRLGEDAGARDKGQPLDEWIAKLHAGRTAAGLVGTSDIDDVSDPMGKGRRSYVEAADEIAALIGRLVALVWGEQ